MSANAQSGKPPVTPEMYARVFENHAEGKLILEDLVLRFHRNPYVKGGHEADRQTAYNAGSCAPIDFILNRINQAAGVDTPTGDQET